MNEQPFTNKEKEVLLWLLAGLPNKLIALKLGVRTKAIEKHLTNIYKKMGLNNRVETILKFKEKE